MTSLSILERSRKMKFSRRAWMILVGGVLAIAYLALAGSLIRHQMERDSLSSQIDSAGSVLAASDDVRRTLEDLEARLAAANRNLAAARSAFPTDLDSNADLDSVLGLAARHGVQVLAVNAEAPDQEPDADAGAYSVLDFDLQAEGDLGSLVSFLAELQGGSVGALAIAAFDFQSGGERESLTLELRAYARTGPVGTAEVGEEDGGAEAASGEAPAAEEGAQ